MLIANFQFSTFNFQLNQRGERPLILHQFKQLRRRFPLQHLKFKVLARNDAVRAKHLLHGLLRKHRMVVLLRKMA